MPYIDPAKQREYARNWIAERRKSYFADKVCVKCGGMQELELDHVNSEDKVSHRIWSWSEERRQIELAKCQVLCRVCHTEKSNKEKRYGERHPKTHLTEDDIRAIRLSTLPRKTLAEQYKVDPQTIKSIRARRSWKHVV